MENNMASGDIKILDKLSINQNIIGLVISYIGVVYIARLDVDNSALYCLVSFIGSLCSILFFICTLSVISSMVVYAIEYWKRNGIKARDINWIMKIRNPTKRAKLVKGVQNVLVKIVNDKR